MLVVHQLVLHAIQVTTLIQALEHVQHVCLNLRSVYSAILTVALRATVDTLWKEQIVVFAIPSTATAQPVTPLHVSVVFQDFTSTLALVPLARQNSLNA